jgi:urease accessory protein UreF
MNFNIFCDSSLPVGGYLFSHGLETKVSLGLVKSEQDLLDFLRESMHNVQYTTAPFVTKTFSILEKDTGILSEILQLDSEIESFLASNSVQNKSSKTSGLGYLNCILKSDITEIKWLKEYKKLVLKGSSSGHFPISFTIMGFYLKLSVHECLFSLLFTTLKNLISAAVRLDVTSAFSGLRILLLLEKEIPEFLSGTLSYSNTCPLLDIYQGRQAYLDSKIFHS